MEPSSYREIKPDMTLDMIRFALSEPIDGYLDVQKGRIPASVLVVIYGTDNPSVIMTIKSRTMRHHAGEIAFPGGKVDTTDTDLLHTALRETAEEIGLSISREQVTCQLKPVSTMGSGYVILPFVTIIDKIPQLSANCEVDKILYIPLEPLLKTVALDTNLDHRTTITNSTTTKVDNPPHIFRYKDLIVWGASARILMQIMDVIQLQSKYKQV